VVVIINFYAVELARIAVTVIHIIAGCSVDLCRHYYRQSAFIRDIEQPGIMLTYIQGLTVANCFVVVCINHQYTLKQLPYVCW